MAVRPGVIRRLAGAALTAVVALATPAAAAPVPLTGQRTIDPMPVGLAFDGSGRAVASWRTFVGKPGEGVLRHRFAVMDRAGHWRTPVTLRGSVSSTISRSPVAGPRSRSTARCGPAARHRRSVIKLLVVDTATGSFRHVHTLAVGPPPRIDPEGTPATLSQPRVAATPDGDLVVVWVRSTSRKASGVWATTMHPNGRFDTPRRIGPLGHSPMLSIADDGRGLLAWQRPAAHPGAGAPRERELGRDRARGHHDRRGDLGRRVDRRRGRAWPAVRRRRAPDSADHGRRAALHDRPRPRRERRLALRRGRRLHVPPGSRYHPCHRPAARAHLRHRRRPLARGLADARERPRRRDGRDAHGERRRGRADGAADPLARNHGRGARRCRARAGRLVRRSLVGRRRARPDRGGRRRNGGGQHGPRHREPLASRRSRSIRAPAACSWCGAREPRRPATGRSRG